MSRITKKPDERKDEIVNSALDLFYAKGFFKTAVSDIVKKLGIAQGTFYYYFKTKDDILDYIVDHYIETIVIESKKIASENNSGAVEKLEKIFINEFGMADESCEFSSKVHLIKDLDLHQRIMIGLIEKYVPVIAKIVRQGVKEGVFKTKFPLESTEILILGFHFLLDPGIINWDEEGYERRIKSSGQIVENTLIAKKGSFRFLPALLIKYIRSYHEFKQNSGKN